MLEVAVDVVLCFLWKFDVVRNSMRVENRSSNLSILVFTVELTVETDWVRAAWDACSSVELAASVAIATWSFWVSDLLIPIASFKAIILDSSLAVVSVMRAMFESCEELAAWRD